jgi:hypothetical protein
LYKPAASVSVPIDVWRIAVRGFFEENRRYLGSIFCVGLILAVTQYFATAIIPAEYITGWYDKIQHAIGGGFCALFGVFVYKLSETDGIHDHETFDQWTMRCAIIFCMVGGLGWEALEHWFPETLNGGPHSFISPDTILDLLFDYLGGLFVGLRFCWDPTVYEKRANAFVLGQSFREGGTYGTKDAPTTPVFRSGSTIKDKLDRP